jgi:hypothetical protein
VQLSLVLAVPTTALPLADLVNPVERALLGGADTGRAHRTQRIDHWASLAREHTPPSTHRRPFFCRFEMVRLKAPEPEGLAGRPGSYNQPPKHQGLAGTCPLSKAPGKKM